MSTREIVDIVHEQVVWEEVVGDEGVELGEIGEGVAAEVFGLDRR